MVIASREKIKQWLLERLISATNTIDPAKLGDNALVLAPHFDDEVLGCGGTIARLTKYGRNVSIWFMTDSGKSHGHLMDEESLSRMRSDEAKRAAQVMGVSLSNLRELEFADASLTNNIDAAVREGIEEFNELRPEIVLFPYRLDGPLDHEACTAVGRRLVEQATWPIVALEYAVWAWHNWPWSQIDVPGRRNIPSIAAKCFFRNLKFLRHFDVKVDIESSLAVKKTALLEYRTQTTRILPTDRWKTFQDVASGTFLENFMLNYEFFSSSRHS